MAIHRIHVPDLADRLAIDADEPIAALRSPQSVSIEGDEAKHAVRVKRLQPGQPVILFDAAGTIARATVHAARRELVLTITHAGRAMPLVPAIDLYTATPKGPRLDKMIDQLSQVGVRSWTPMGTALGVVDPRETRLDRMQRIALEAAKQAGRAWAMQLGDKTEYHEAIQSAGSGTGLTLVCDGSGDYFQPTPTTEQADEIRIMIGPEGGFTPEELDHARQLGVPIIGLGPTILRIETAAVVAAGLVGWAFGLREPEHTETG